MFPYCRQVRQMPGARGTCGHVLLVERFAVLATLYLRTVGSLLLPTHFFLPEPEVGGGSKPQGRLRFRSGRKGTHSVQVTY